MTKKKIITIIAWAIPILVTIYLFVLSNKKYEPVYSVVNSPSIIYNKNNSSSKIKILVNDTLKINENIYTTTIALWNKGKLPITKELLRKDFIISCNEGTSKIIDYKILKQRIDSISNFRLIPTNKGIKIDWDYFDPKFGLLLQVIYSGTEKTQINISGYILGSTVKEVSIKTEDKKKKRIMIIILPVLIICWIIIALVFYKGPDKEEIKLGGYIFSSLVLIIVIIILFLYRTDLFYFNIPF